MTGRRWGDPAKPGALMVFGAGAVIGGMLGMVAGVGAATALRFDGRAVAMPPTATMRSITPHGEGRK